MCRARAGRSTAASDQIKTAWFSMAASTMRLTRLVRGGGLDDLTVTTLILRAWGT